MDSHKQEPFLSALQNMGIELVLGIYTKNQNNANYEEFLTKIVNINNHMHHFYMGC